MKCRSLRLGLRRFGQRFPQSLCRMLRTLQLSSPMVACDRSCFLCSTCAMAEAPDSSTSFDAPESAATEGDMRGCAQPPVLWRVEGSLAATSDTLIIVVDFPATMTSVYCCWIKKRRKRRGSTIKHQLHTNKSHQCWVVCTLGSNTCSTNVWRVISLPPQKETTRTVKNKPLTTFQPACNAE